MRFEIEKVKRGTWNAKVFDDDKVVKEQVVYGKTDYNAKIVAKDLVKSLSRPTSGYQMQKKGFVESDNYKAHMRMGETLLGASDSPSKGKVMQEWANATPARWVKPGGNAIEPKHIRGAHPFKGEASVDDASKDDSPSTEFEEHAIKTSREMSLQSLLRHYAITQREAQKESPSVGSETKVIIKAITDEIESRVSPDARETEEGDTHYERVAKGSTLSSLLRDYAQLEREFSANYAKGKWSSDDNALKKVVEDEIMARAKDGSERESASSWKQRNWTRSGTDMATHMLAKSKSADAPPAKRKRSAGLRKSGMGSLPGVVVRRG